MLSAMLLSAAPAAPNVAVAPLAAMTPRARDAQFCSLDALRREKRSGNVNWSRPLASDRATASASEEKAARTSEDAAPPPYEAVEASAEPATPSKLATALLGSKLATARAEAKAARRAAELERIHDAWANLGLDTRAAMRNGEKLPPFFESPPRCGPQQMEAIIRAEFGGSV